ncbi:Protein of unknown function [Prosthecobacter debontii]|uniref:DUF3592 domain-containing protein n=1 Tax=Prosthecobacter debontii TaxID=48467 RepID=A0A1T4XR81_9BACT|nr:DUF3592 domain-containing protein [Prosthecobacter debontii]SKA92057.1 Protein of unknown function [Prosthecobacter debontii]
MSYSRTSSGDTFLIPFGLVFILAGLGVGIFYFSMVSGWYAARSWVKVPCIIESSSLEDHVSHDSDSGTSVTYSAVATYRYEFEGRSYQGREVSLSSGSDNFGDFQQQAASILQQHEESGQPFRCFVNPERPEEAVIFREGRWTLLLFLSLFPVAFPLAGGFVMSMGLSERRQKKERELAKSQHPEAPWRWQTRWQDEWIRPKNAGFFKGWLMVAIWLTIVWGPIIYATLIGGDGELEDTFSWVVLILTVPLLFIWRAAIRRVLDQRQGLPQIHVQPMPASPGASLDIQVAIPPRRSVSMRDHLHAEVRCVKQVTTHSGKSTTTREETLWSDTISASFSDAVREDRGSRLPLRIDLPAELPASPLDSEGGSHGERYDWELRVKMPKLRHPVVFDLPVFESAETTVSTDPLAPPKSARKARPSVESILALDADELTMHLAKHHITAVFDRHNLPMSFDLSPRRYASARLFLTIFNTIWTGVFFLLVTLDAPFIFPLIWGVTSALFWWVIIRQFEHRHIDLDAAALEIRQTLGPWSSKKRFERRHLLEFSSRMHMSSGSTSYYEVRADTTFGKRVTLMDGIPSKLVADNLVPLLEQWRKQA